MPVLIVADLLFTFVDKDATMRQVYQIAELGKPTDEPTRARDEVLGQIFNKGDPVPKRKLTFHIEVTDEGTTKNIRGSVKRAFQKWRRIGRLTFDNAVTSYNGDFVIHFNHPGWRDDRNNPATANRAALS